MDNPQTSSPSSATDRNSISQKIKVPLEFIMEQSSDAIIVCSSDRTVLSMNLSAERLFGYSSTELIGKSSDSLIPRELLKESHEIIARINTDGTCGPFETVRISKTGIRIDVQITIISISAEIDECVRLVVICKEKPSSRVPIKDRRRSFSTQESRSIVLDTVRRVAMDILLSRTGVESLSQIAEAARTLAGAQYAALGVARQDGKGLQEFFAIGMTEEEETRIGPRPIGVGILGLLLQRTDPLRINVLAEHPNSVGFPANHPPMESFLGVPIRRGKTVLGSLYLTNKIGGGSFTAADETAVQGLGEYAAVSIYYMQMLQRQRALASVLITTQEEERRAVAYDLHDGLTQFVMAAHAHLEAFVSAHKTGKIERADRELKRGLKYLKDAVIESRRLISGLRSLALDDLGLGGALEQLISEEKAHSGWILAEFDQNIEDRRFDKSLETTIYRVAQEALTNVRKHSGTDRVRVHLWTDFTENPEEERLKLEVQDWGIGFDTDQHAVDISRVGLQGMAERVRLLNGIFQIISVPTKGTLIHADFSALQQTHKREWAEI